MHVSVYSTEFVDSINSNLHPAKSSHLHIPTTSTFQWFYLNYKAPQTTGKSTVFKQIVQAAIKNSEDSSVWGEYNSYVSPILCDAVAKPYCFIKANLIDAIRNDCLPRQPLRVSPGSTNKSGSIKCALGKNSKPNGFGQLFWHRILNNNWCESL